MGAEAEIRRMMRGLGILFIGSITLSMSIDGRPLLSVACSVLAVPFLAVLLGYVDVRMVRFALGITVAATGAAAGLGIAAWTPRTDPYGLELLSMAALVAAAGSYAWAMAWWCRSGGWQPSAAAWRYTAVCMFTASGLLMTVCVLVGGFGAESTGTADEGWGTAFGRTADGWLFVSATIAVSLILLIGIALAARAHRLMTATMSTMGAPRTTTAPHRM